MVLKNLIAIAFLILTPFMLPANTEALHVDSVYAFSTPVQSDSSDISVVAKFHFGTDCYYNGYAVYATHDSIMVTLCYITGNSLVVCSRRDTLHLGIFPNQLYHVALAINYGSNSNCLNSGRDTTNFDFNATVSAVDENQYLEILMLPNPAFDKLHCKLDILPIGRISYEIFTSTGRKVSQEDIRQPNFEVDLNNLPSGLYFLQLQSENQTLVKKFVKY